MYAASKGQGKGKTKACWHCREVGYFQRERRHLHPQGKDSNAIVASKAKAKGKGEKGKNGKGKHKMGMETAKTIGTGRRGKLLAKGD